MYRPLGWASLTALAMLSLGGCETAPPLADVSKPVPTTPRAAAPAPAERTETRRAPWEDPASPIYRRIIYFSYDGSDILPAYVPLLRTHADYLAEHPDTRITVDGHTDERGTREYNLALGDRRAEAVRRFLITEGVPERQMATLSYGEEKPASRGHSEAAWSQNRRAELRYEGR